MREWHAIHVVLRDGSGRYLAGQKDTWSFTEDLTNAHVFDFVGDHIAEQLEALKRDHGLALNVVPVDPPERYETCDMCGHRALPYSTFFDGKQYFCPDCSPPQATGLVAGIA